MIWDKGYCYNDSCLTTMRPPHLTNTLTLLSLLSFIIPLTAPTLNANFTSPSSSTPIPMVTNNLPAPDFLLNSPFLDCSLPYIYTYNQSDQSLANNTPTYIVITTGVPITLGLTTKYSTLSPTLGASQCLPPGCTIPITNNCKEPIHYNNYFDILQLSLASSATPFAATLSYYVYCKQTFSPNTLQWGLILQILLVTIMVAVVAMYSRPWSLGGRAIEVNYWLILVFFILLGLGAVVAALSEMGITICLYIVSLVLGILCIGICTNQLLFLLRAKFLTIVLFRVQTFEFKTMQALSLLVGLGFTLGWLFSDSNIILNDILSICICVGLTKILKFTSLKMAGVAFLTTITLELVVVIVIYVILGQSYNNLFLNDYNFPIQLQFPTINPTYNQKCAWLPITSVIFPGMLLSYLRRFDTSRNTHVYLVTSAILFLVGGVAWVFVNIPANVTFPFGLISEPCMFGLVCIFAYQRREIRVIWSGEFYDEEFANQDELRVIMEMIDRTGEGQMGQEGEAKRRSTIDRGLIQDLKVSGRRGSRMSEESVVRSKFLR